MPDQNTQEPNKKRKTSKGGNSKKAVAAPKKPVAAANKKQPASRATASMSSKKEVAAPAESNSQFHSKNPVVAAKKKSASGASRAAASESSKKEAAAPPVSSYQQKEPTQVNSTSAGHILVPEQQPQIRGGAFQFVRAVQQSAHSAHGIAQDDVREVASMSAIAIVGRNIDALSAKLACATNLRELFETVFDLWVKKGCVHKGYSLVHYAVLQVPACISFHEGRRLRELPLSFTYH